MNRDNIKDKETPFFQEGGGTGKAGRGRHIHTPPSSSAHFCYYGQCCTKIYGIIL